MAIAPVAYKANAAAATAMCAGKNSNLRFIVLPLKNLRPPPVQYVFGAKAVVAPWSYVAKRQVIVAR
jgi:hypothetical protein